MIAIYASLMCLALGLFTSMSFLALSHILVIIPALYFTTKTNFKKLNLSTWFLFAMSISFILSVLLNQDIAAKGFSSITKTKYYFFAIFSIAPLTYFFSKLSSEETTKKVNHLLLALIITTTLAGFVGILGASFGFNPIKWDDIISLRNRGFAGMVLNYAHNLAIFQIVITGMIYCRNEVKKYIDLNLLYLAWLVNLVALYLTYSRGPLLAFIVAIPFYFFKNNKKMFLSIILVLTLAVAGLYVVAGKSMSRQESDLGRISQWKSAIAAFKERPILGVGYMNFEPMSQPLKVKYNISGADFGGHAHSNYFEALASTGIIGFVFFMLWQIFWFIEMYKRNDIIGKIALPFIICFIAGGLTQATFTLGANLFLSMAFYSLTQLNVNILKNNNK